MGVIAGGLQGVAQRVRFWIILRMNKEVNETTTNEIEAKWAAESEERIDAVDRGELQTVDGPSALQDLRSLLKH